MADDKSENYADTNYAQTEYLDDPTSGVKDAPAGPIAVPRLVRGEDGLMHTVYVNPKTGSTLNDLNGYTIISSDGGIYKVTAKDDSNKDGTVDTTETQKNTSAALGIGNHTTHEDANGHTPGPAASMSNNFGYREKPGYMGALTLGAGLINPGAGAVASMFSKAMNVSNMEAVNNARKALGLTPLTGKQMVSQAMKDNGGQVGRVSIGKGQYSVGFKALDPQGRTNLTPAEAAKRSAMFGGIKEVPDDKSQSTASKIGSRISKALGIEPGAVGKALGSLGLQKGFATKTLDHIFGVTPSTAPTPTTRPEDMGQVTPGASSATRAKNASSSVASKVPSPAMGAISHPNNPAGVSYSGIGTGRPQPPDPGLMSKVEAAATKTLGPTAVVDVSSGTYSAEKKESITRAREEAAAKPGATKASIDAAGKKAGQVGSTRHTTGKAVDFGVSYTDSNGKKQSATPEQMADVAANFTKDNPEAGVGFGKGYMDKDGRSRTHIDTTGAGGSWGAGGKSANMSQAMKETVDAARAGYQPTPFSNAPTPSSSPGTVPGKFTSQDERSENTGNVRNATAPTSAAAALDHIAYGKVPDNVGAPSRPTVGTGFVSQDAKANTGGVKNYTSSFVSQDERESMATRMGVTPVGLDPVGNSLSPTSNASKVTAPSTAQTNVGAKTVANAVQSTTAPGQADAKIGTSPAARAAMGLTNRTQAEKAAMATTMAGELSQKSLSALAQKDPKAVAEVGNMIATMENRAGTKQYGSISKALTPSQYNSLTAANIATTNQNYSKNKAALAAAIGQYYSGKPTPGVNYKNTSYYNPDIANPDWAASMQNPTQVGPHLFGSLPNYGPSAAEQAAAAAMSTMAGTNYSSGKMKDDTPGAYSGSGTGSTYGGSPGTSGGGGYTPGGVGSPSGSSAGDYGGGNYGGNGNSSYGGNGYGSGAAGGGSAYGGSAGTSGGGGYSPGGMGSPSGSSTSSGGGGYNPGAGAGGGYSPGGIGSPSGSSAGGTNGSGSSKGAQSRSDGWN